MNDTDDFITIQDDYSSYKCDYCNQFISLMPLTTNDHKFCDIICAKLFCNENGLKSIRFNKLKYDEYYRNGLLSPLAMTTYVYLQKMSFELLPKSRWPEKDKELFKQKYITALSNYINQVL